MKPYLLALLLAASAASTPGPAQAQKSALDGHQFDGVISDKALKTAGRTRREWLDRQPAEAREYWAAWDCKDKPCDSKWYANIRAKAALIRRSSKDPKPAATVPPANADGA